MIHDLLMLPGHMCDARLWRDIRLDDARLHHADLGLDDRIEAMADRALASAPARFVAVGFSMGGIVAMHVAARAPDRVVGLVLLDTNAGPDLADRAAARLRQQALARAGGLRRIVSEELKPSYLSPINRGRQEILSLTMDMALSLGVEVFCRQSEALRTRPDARPLLPRIDVPTFVACGADDPLCPPDWHRDLASRISRAKLSVLGLAGHLLPLERPAGLSALLNGFLARLPEGVA